MLIQIFTFKDSNLVENLTNLADTPKKNSTPHGLLGLLFPTLGTLETWWSQGKGQGQGARARGVVVGIVKGKSRAEALFSPVRHYTTLH